MALLPVSWKALWLTETHQRAQSLGSLHSLYSTCSLVLTDAHCSCLEAKVFFGVVEKTCVFFTSSHPRLVAIYKAQEECSIPTLHLKKLCDTRLASCVNAVSILRKIYPVVLRSLEDIKNQETNAVVASDCDGLYHVLMERFKFIVKLFVWEDLLQQVKSLSYYLQPSKMDLLHGAELISTTVKALQEGGVKSCLQIYSATEVGIDPSFEKLRSKHKNMMVEEVCRDEAVTNPETKVKVNFFYTFYDTCLLQMES